MGRQQLPGRRREGHEHRRRARRQHVVHRRRQLRLHRTDIARRRPDLVHRTAAVWPVAITAGADGNLWFTTSLINASVWRITTAGVITTFAGPDIDHPTAITAGPDGNVWFTNNGFGTFSIGRIAADGTVSTIGDSTINRPSGITAGSGRRHVVHQSRYNSASGGSPPSRFRGAPDPRHRAQPATGRRPSTWEAPPSDGGPTIIGLHRDCVAGRRDLHRGPPGRCPAA